ENLILLSLYVDDRGKCSGGPFKTIGEKWATFEQENFKQVTQPLYVLLGPGGQLLNYPVGYTPEKQYQQWLECGLRACRFLK
ncbi:MAG: protein-disulfide reductase, partial [Bacteroidota bacterium]|nr:protein-disulfide reductase [Bacteroidota bacterium]